jgi:RNA polymerase sigma-70 factor, ECF subfamily
MNPGDDEHDHLIEAVARARDREAFARLFDHFAPRLKAYLMKAGATPAAAEDFAQDAMLVVWRKADLFDAGKARAATWIFTIARNRRIDALRRAARPLPSPDIDPTPQGPDRPDELFESREDAGRVRAALRGLSPDQIEVIRMAFFQDQTHSDIAQSLDLPLGTVKSRIRNAMIKLRHLLEPETPL